MSNHHTIGMNHHFDPHGILGTIFTFLITFFGMITVNEYAVFVGMAVGITTIGLNVMKMVNEYKRGRQIDEELDDDDDQDAA